MIVTTIILEDMSALLGSGDLVGIGSASPLAVLIYGPDWGSLYKAVTAADHTIQMTPGKPDVFEIFIGDEVLSRANLDGVAGKIRRVVSYVGILTPEVGSFLANQLLGGKSCVVGMIAKTAEEAVCKFQLFTDGMDGIDGNVTVISGPAS